jgi:hypothetical protein
MAKKQKHRDPAPSVAATPAPAAPAASRFNQLQSNLAFATNRLRRLQASYDAAVTNTGNEAHWAAADNLDPHSVATLNVRQRLRSRSRYEIVENNPYLKGVSITLCNDFVGGGPKLQITDPRFSEEQRARIEQRWATYSQKIKLRQKLWQLRMAKFVDGESFGVKYYDSKLEAAGTVPVNYQIVECDRISSLSDGLPSKSSGAPASVSEIDGVRFDEHQEPLEYHLLKFHPGNTLFRPFSRMEELGQWIPAKHVIHWYRKDRNWLRGIPELAASLPLCAILRRYMLALVAQAEAAADLSVLFESEAPAVVGANPWNPSGATEQAAFEPFDTFPMERGITMALPWGMKAKQLDAVPTGAEADAFIGTILRAIMRPALVTYGNAIGSSKDSNMASALVDSDVYKTGHHLERIHCNEEVLDPIFADFWTYGVLLEDFFDNAVSGDAGISSQFADLRTEAPQHCWRYDQIGLVHTDPAKVASAITTLRQDLVMTDRQIQETFYNRDIRDWQAEVLADYKFREQFEPEEPEDTEPKPPGASKPKAKPKAGTSNGDD